MYWAMSKPARSLSPEAFAKLDPSDDDQFYATPRLVNHIDDKAIAALSQFYASILMSDSEVLDLMSSWVSHLPLSYQGRVVGHGMNAGELRANARLAAYFVQNLNKQTSLPLAASSFDAALCCVGVQYLARPYEVFADVARVLKPGAPFIVSFSNRCFPTKAIAIWRALDGRGHAELVSLYLQQAGFENIKTHILVDGASSDPLTAVVGYRSTNTDE
jgi:SAM-dependent methyltransferase